jgi:predicted ester cyclase
LHWRSCQGVHEKNDGIPSNYFARNIRRITLPNKGQILSSPAGLSVVELGSINKLYQAFNDRRPELLDEACWSDWEDVPLAPGQQPGVEGFKKLMPVFFAAFPDLRIEVDEIIGAAGCAGVRARLLGTHLGMLFGVSPSGQRVEVRMYEFHHLRDGRVSHTWHLEDWFGMFQRIGCWPLHQN